MLCIFLNEDYDIMEMKITYEFVFHGLSFLYDITDTDKRESIERCFANKGYKSFNEYVCAVKTLLLFCAHVVDVLCV